MAMPLDTQPDSGHSTPPSKSRKSKKKKVTKPAKLSTNGISAESNGIEDGPGQDQEQEQEDPDVETSEHIQVEHTQTVSDETPVSSTFPVEEDDPGPKPELQDILKKQNGVKHDNHDLAHASAVANDQANLPEDISSDAERRLEVAAQERVRLKAEVMELRGSLESLQQRHEEDRAGIQRQLEVAESGRDHAQDQYQKLLGKVNTLKTQLGERLKADAAELSQARTQLEDLEQENHALKENHQSLQAEISSLSTAKDELAQEISNLRGRTNVSQQNWAKERDDLLSREAQAKEEFEVAKQAMQDWEVLAMEERSVREGLGDRVAELEEQLSNQRDAYDRAATERDSQSVTVDGLQRALQDIQEARKQELRELVENSHTQLGGLKKQLQTAEESATRSQKALEIAQQELERALPFEKEVKEKNLLIGKVRHEAVILNDHLTKALRFLRKGKLEDNVDRQLVTNHFLHFITLDRSDPKKFQVLQLISALLGWTEEQNESAGLLRPGFSNSTTPSTTSSTISSTLRLPLSSPFRRASSTASLVPPSPSIPSPDPQALQSPGSKDSLAELWSDFLEREAQEGIISSSKASSRRTSQSVGSATPTVRRETVLSPTGPGIASGLVRPPALSEQSGSEKK